MPENGKKIKELAQAFRKAINLAEKGKGFIKRKKTKFQFPLLNYGPKEKNLKRAMEIFRRMENLLFNNLFVSESSGQKYNAIIKNVKRKVLLIE